MTARAAASKGSNAIRGVPEVNPDTGLSTDYLNHFSEALMILEMLPAAPECLDDLLAWGPCNYVEHFERSGFADAGHVIAAYRAAEPAVIRSLDILTEVMTATLLGIREALAAHGYGPRTAELAARGAGALKPLVARAAAVINGTAPTLWINGRETAAEIDAIFGR